MSQNLPVGARPARQARSAKTTHRIVTALEELLKEKHFEHITMAELAKHAGLTPGAIYRRFENKQALLPHIFQRHSEMFAEWLKRNTAESLAAGSESMTEAFNSLVLETTACFRENKHIFRTVHLYGRLHPEKARSGDSVNPRADFAPIFGLLKIFNVEPQMGQDAACQFLGFILVSSCTDRALYSDLLPARHLDMDDQCFARHLAEMFTAWLK